MYIYIKWRCLIFIISTKNLNWIREPTLMCNNCLVWSWKWGMSIMKIAPCLYYEWTWDPGNCFVRWKFYSWSLFCCSSPVLLLLWVQFFFCQGRFVIICYYSVAVHVIGCWIWWCLDVVDVRGIGVAVLFVLLPWIWKAYSGVACYFLAYHMLFMDRGWVVLVNVLFCFVMVLV
jgi:hypothetical protein